MESVRVAAVRPLVVPAGLVGAAAGLANGSKDVPEPEGVVREVVPAVMAVEPDALPSDGAAGTSFDLPAPNPDTEPSSDAVRGVDVEPFGANGSFVSGFGSATVLLGDVVEWSA